jgi:hypothetical protein
VIDPADPSDYRSPHLINDNLDPGRGSLFYRDDQGNLVFSDANHVLSVPGRQGGVDGDINVVLAATTHASGDNYQVEASFEPTFPCAPAGGPDTCAKTAIVTAWKRVYLEVDKMFRAGASISATVAAGATEIPVNNGNAFHVGDQVVLVHAPGIGASAEGFYYETAMVAHVRRGRHHGAIQLANPTNHAYADAPVLLPSGTEVTDGVGIVNAGAAALYDAPTGLVPTLFETAYVDYKFLSTGGGAPNTAANSVPYVPFLRSIDVDVEPVFADRWCETCGASGAFDNHRHIIIASELTNLPNISGETNLDDQPAAPFTYVFRGRIDDLVRNDPIYSSISADGWASETLVHELAHTWDVNPPTSSTGGHCNLRDWDNTDDCLMNRSNTASLANGIVKLHQWTDPACEYRRIRTQPEPMPQHAER